MPQPTHDAVRSLERATAITKACATAGITDPAEIPTLIAFARAAEEFNSALAALQLAERDWNRFVATHGADDPGQDYYATRVNAAREIFLVAKRAHSVALVAWRISRGLDSTALAA
jgi:hypothetical protein